MSAGGSSRGRGGTKGKSSTGATIAEAAVDPALAFPRFTPARRARAELVASALRSGHTVPDTTFDAIYPDAVRRASAAHWTPVRVCARAVALLQLEPGARLLDIGAGAGKFCIVAAAMTGAQVRGVEREPHLAEAGREAARRLGIAVDIVDGTFDAEDPTLIDAVYIFNPFTETFSLEGTGRVVPSDRFAGRADADIAAAQEFLRGLRPGTRVVTFCGVGGKVPPDCARVDAEEWEGGALELWERIVIPDPAR